MMRGQGACRVPTPWGQKQRARFLPRQKPWRELLSVPGKEGTHYPWPTLPGIFCWPSRQLPSTCQRASAQLPPLSVSHHSLQMGQDPRPVQDTLALPFTPHLPSTPHSTCFPWWWSTSAVSGSLDTSTTGSTSFWPCECPPPRACSQLCPNPPFPQPHHPTRTTWPCLGA